MNPFTDLPRRKPVRRKRSKPRRGPWRSEEYRRWISRRLCAICWGNYRSDLQFVQQDTSVSQAAHTEKNGMSSKGSDASCLPLCTYHHDWYDGRMELEPLEQFFEVDLQKVAKQYYERWLAEGNGTEA